MGWDYADAFKDENAKDEKNECLLSDWKESYKETFFKNVAIDKSFSEALNRYDEIRPGDYILTKLYKSAACYVGKVETPAYYDIRRTHSTEHGCYSWVVDVDWKYIGSFLCIPDSLRGIMQGRMKTIRKIDHKWPQCSIMRSLYDGTRAFLCELTCDNFHLGLDPNSLEDLVAFYIAKLNTGFRILPSSCKTNEPALEYMFVNGLRKIACQVKSNEEIDVKDYSFYSFKEYDKIYLFSGKGYMNKTLDIENICVVPNDELYKFLKSCYEEGNHFYPMLNKYYRFKS